MSLKYVQCLTFYQSGSGNIVGATSVVLTNFQDIYGNILTMSDFGTTGYCTAESDTTNEEAFTFTGVVANANGTYTLTGVKTALAKSPYTETSGLVRAHAGGTKVVITDNVAFWNTFANLNNDNVFTGKNEGVAPTTSLGFVTRDYMLALINGGPINVSQVNITGTAGETFAQYAPVYLKTSDSRWYKLLANDAQLLSIQNIQIGIAMGAGTAGVAITGGVTLSGQITTLSGLTANSLYYISDTGTLAVTAGTYSVPVGLATSTSTLIFFPKNANIPTPNEKAAMGTINTAPSTSNKFATQADLGASYLTIPLGESFTGATTPQPALMLNDIYQFRISGMWACGTTSGSSEKTALRIIPRSTVLSQTINAIIGKTGSPGDNIQITVQTDNAGSPSSTPIANGTSTGIAGASLSTSVGAYKTFSFASPFTLTAGTTYWIVFERTSTTSDINCYSVGGQLNQSAANIYASFIGKTYYGSAWSNAPGNGQGNMPYVEIIPSSGSGSYSLWQSDADFNTGFYSEHMQSFMGICTTTGAAGVNGTFYLSGNCPGFTSLIPFTDYYVSTTKGALTSTPGGQYAGTAVSATQLNIPPSKIGHIFQYNSVTAGNLGTSNMNNLVIKIPFDGWLNWTNQGSSQIQFNIADDPTMVTNVVNFSNNASAASTYTAYAIPLRRGQYFQFVEGGGSTSTVYFTPRF